MTEEKNNPTDGPGEAVIDEPTEHALDPASDPNTEWEEKAAEQMSEGEGGSGSDAGSGTAGNGTSGDAASDDAASGDSEESGS